MEVKEVMETLELIKIALEKQVPKKPVFVKEDDELEKGRYACPVCNGTVGVFDMKDNYCSECGQKMHWSRNE